MSPSGASDGTDQLSDIETLQFADTVFVPGSNSAPTEIFLVGTTVDENAPGMAIGTLTASDPDASDSHTYTVDDTRFEAVGDQLQLKAGQSLDHESKPSVALQITATDSGGLSLAQGFVLTVNDLNEAPSSLALAGDTVGENAAGVAIGTLTASDPDVGDSHTYTVDDTRFEVVGDQLKLKAGQSLDHESEPSVALQITATESGGLSLAQGFALTVNDLNEAPVAADDAVTVAASGATTILALSLLTNDSDEDGNPLSISTVGNALGGTAVLDGNGDVVLHRRCRLQRRQLRLHRLRRARRQRHRGGNDLPGGSRHRPRYDRRPEPVARRFGCGKRDRPGRRRRCRSVA